MNVAIIGAGKVGTVLATALYQLGYHISSVSSNSMASAEKLAKVVNSVVSTDFLAISEAEIVFITTNDANIKKVATSLAQKNVLQKNQFVFHCSGAADLSVLAPVQKQGALIGSIHPLQSFAENQLTSLQGVYMAINGVAESLFVAKKIVRELGGKILVIPEEKRALYHAAATIASNYLVTLMQSSLTLLTALDIAEEEAFLALLPLVLGSLNNIKHKGCAKGLTGPIARGDYKTVRAHLTMIQQFVPQELELYKVLGRKTVQLSQRVNNISKENYEQLQLALE